MRVNHFGVYIGILVVFGYAWLSVMKFRECVVRFCVYKFFVGKV